MNLINNLSIIKTRISLDNSQTYKIINISKKLIVVLTNLVIYIIFKRVYLSSLNHPINIIIFCH